MKHAWFPVTLSFVLTHSSDRFNDINRYIYICKVYKPSFIYFTNLHYRRGGKLKLFVQLLRSNTLSLWQQEDMSSLRLLSGENSGRQMKSNFSLRQKLNLYLKEKLLADLNYNLKELVIHIRMSQLSTILDVKAIKNFRFDKVD